MKDSFTDLSLNVFIIFDVKDGKIVEKDTKLFLNNYLSNNITKNRAPFKLTVNNKLHKGITVQ